MKPLFFILTLLLFAACASVAQAQQKTSDIVVLKNGDRYAGEILRYEQGKKLTLRQPDGVEVEIDDADILKITQGVPVAQGLPGEPPTPLKKEVKPRTKGLWNTASVAFGLGGGNNESGGLAIAAGLHNVLGFQWSPAFGAGVGFGMDNYSRRGETVFPLYAEFRSYLPGKKKSHNLYLALAGGWGFAFEREKLDIIRAEGGWMAHPAVGYRTATKEGTDVNLDLGVKFQKALFQQQLGNGDVETRDLLFRRLTVRIGLTLWK